MLSQRARLRGSALTLVCLAVAVLGVPNAVAKVRVTLRPSTGGIHTGFVLRFRNPVVTGTVAGVRRVDRIIARGPRGAHCESLDSYALRSAAAGATMRTTIAPGRGRHWCPGHFSGRVVAYQSTPCGPGPARACPLLVVPPRILARFSFRVRPVPSRGGGSGAGGSPGSGTGGGTGTGTDVPAFAGLRSATTCRGAPPIHGPVPGGTYTLTWTSATDPVTPSSAIVYRIFFAASPGAENFSSPTWTTAPGATAYSGNLATRGPAYFVVRARNAAGQEDTNTIERVAVNSC